MMDEFDNKLKNAMKPSKEADFWLNQKIINFEEATTMKTTKWRKTAAVLTTICLLCIGSISVIAAVNHYTASQVAESTGDDTLAQAFESGMSQTINETQRVGNYDITLLGLVSGENLSDFGTYVNDELLADRTYAALAISNADGSPLAEKDETGYYIGYTDCFFVTPFIEGYNPGLYNAYLFNGGMTNFVEDGVLYWLVECDNIEIFAEHTIYLAVTKDLGSINSAYNYDETSGRITRNEKYDGVNALFTLPIDKSNGSQEAIDEYLKSLEEQNEEDEEDAFDPEKETTEKFVENLTEENINEYCVLLEDTVQTLKIDQDGYIHYNWKTSDAEGSGYQLIDENFVSGKLYTLGYSMEDDNSAEIETIILNPDGTATFAIYRPKE